MNKTYALPFNKGGPPYIKHGELVSCIQPLHTRTGENPAN